jgi:hypothetical protein
VHAPIAVTVPFAESQPTAFAEPSVIVASPSPSAALNTVTSAVRHCGIICRNSAATRVVLSDAVAATHVTGPLVIARPYQCEEIGLRLNTSKCEFISHTAQSSDPAFANFIHLKVDQSDLLGAPLTSGEAMDRALSGR